MMYVGVRGAGASRSFYFYSWQPGKGSHIHSYDGKKYFSTAEALYRARQKHVDRQAAKKKTNQHKYVAPYNVQLNAKKRKQIYSWAWRLRGKDQIKKISNQISRLQKYGGFGKKTAISQLIIIADQKKAYLRGVKKCRR